MMRRIRDDTTILGMMQVTRPLELRLRLKEMLDVEIHAGLKASCTSLEN